MVEALLGRLRGAKPPDIDESRPRRLGRSLVQAERSRHPRGLTRAPRNAQPAAVVHAAEQVGEGSCDQRWPSALGEEADQLTRHGNPPLVIDDTGQHFFQSGHRWGIAWPSRKPDTVGRPSEHPRRFQPPDCRGRGSRPCPRHLLDLSSAKSTWTGLGKAASGRYKRKTSEPDPNVGQLEDPLPEARPSGQKGIGRDKAEATHGLDGSDPIRAGEWDTGFHGEPSERRALPFGGPGLPEN